MPISIYPPILQSTQTAFLASTTSYPIYFTLQSFTTWSEIGHVQIRVVQQNNNKVIASDKYPSDGIIYKNATEVQKLDDGRYCISIFSTDIAPSWQPGTEYKIQLRFGMNPIYSSLSEFATWKQQQITQSAFSEWSTVMMIKAISKPEPYIKNATSVPDVVTKVRAENTITPLFMAGCTIKEEEKEPEREYKFDLYSDGEGIESKLIETSGYLTHINDMDTHRFKTVLHNGSTYRVIYSIITKNGYEASAEPYIFVVAQNYWSEIKGMTLEVTDDDVYCLENGCIKVAVTTDSEIIGTYVITRSDEKSNFSVWEDIKFLLFKYEMLESKIVYTDFTVESGVKYKYAIQEESRQGYRSAPLYEDKSPARMVNLEYSYLSRDGIQLALKYNNKMNSFKHTVLSSKQDTLGDKYPHIMKNGYAYYAEFPVTGLISFHMDEYQTFMTQKDDGFYFGDEKIIPLDKFPELDNKRTADNTEEVDASSTYMINTNLIHDNFFVERKFREKVEEFLNNFEYKLFRSPSEGNLIVVLTNVSMTPNATLGRMIYEFSATAYEVAECTLENLNEYKIINIGSTQEIDDLEITIRSFGQVQGLYTPDVANAYELIKQQEEAIYSSQTYKTKMDRITSFWIDLYPKDKLQVELLELEAKRSELIKEGQDTAEVDAEIAVKQKLLSLINSHAVTTIILKADDKKIVVMPNKIYSLRQPVTSLMLESCPVPIVINYTSELSPLINESEGGTEVSAVDIAHPWGQLSGVFTTTDKILSIYNPNQEISDRYRIFNPNPDGTVIYDNEGGRIVDNTNYNVYKTTNLYAVIEEETRKEVEHLYNVQGGFEKDESGRWNKGNLYYEFSDILTFDIEADPGTILSIGSNEDGSDAKDVMIGPTGHYTLRPMEDLVRYIVLKDGRPQFCVINYKSLTTQLIAQENKAGEMNVRILERLGLSHLIR